MDADTVMEHLSLDSREEAERRIHRDLEFRLAYYVEHPEMIDERLAELDDEWDTERVLEAGASGIALYGMLRGMLGKRRYYLLPLLVSGFLMQHAIQGWCPPLRLIRGYGVRTRYEIELERYALKALRGDMDQIKDERNKSDGPLKALNGKYRSARA